MNSGSDMLFLHALTGLHPGSGTALGVVDLPVQRERHTHWPTIPGTSLKGILRAACRPAKGDEESKNRWLAVFGPETADAAKHAGAVALTDARILAFPVRSLKGVFAWTTCPAAIERLARDAQLAGLEKVPPAPAVPDDKVCCAKGSALLADGKSVLLEEFEFERIEGDTAPLADWIAKHAASDETVKKRLPSHLAILSDNDFTHFVRHATEVVARVGLNYDTKTVKDGALFYEEFLPPETLFYSLVFGQPARRKDVEMGASAVLDFLRTRRDLDLLQVGAGETIGKGLCAARFAGTGR